MSGVLTDMLLAIHNTHRFEHYCQKKKLAADVKGKVLARVEEVKQEAAAAGKPPPRDSKLYRSACGVLGGGFAELKVTELCRQEDGHKCCMFSEPAPVSRARLSCQGHGCSKHVQARRGRCCCC